MYGINFKNFSTTPRPLLPGDPISFSFNERYLSDESEGNDLVRESKPEQPK